MIMLLTPLGGLDMETRMDTVMSQLLYGDIADPVVLLGVEGKKGVLFGTTQPYLALLGTVHIRI